jgi:3-dehydroshikimate dehydratase
MIRLGLSSQAFPAMATKDILKLAVDAGLEGVEWAAESHLVPGDIKAAQSLMMETLWARLAVVSYSALYRVHPGSEAGLGFESLLDTAQALHAPILRIFAGSQPWSRLGSEARAGLVAELRRLGDLADSRGITVCLSLSRGTALEDYAAAEGLLGELAHPFVRLAWEAMPGGAQEEATGALERLRGQTSLLLARHSDRLGRSSPLGDEAEAWQRRLASFLSGETEPKMSRFVLLGRIGGGEEARLKEDAAFLAGLARAFAPARKA